MTDGDLLFYDPGTGERLTYEELRAALAEPVWPVTFTRNDSAGVKQVIVALLAAVVLGFELTLRDESFSLTFNENAVDGQEESQALHGRAFASVNEMIAAARQAKGFRLTLYTSGSTGLPKRVRHTLAGLTRMLKVGERHAGAIWGLAYNPAHIAGVQVVLQAFFNRNALVQLFGRDRHAVVSWLQALGVTHLSATPSFYRLLLPTDRVLPAVKSVTLGGERCDTELVVKLRRMFPAARILNLYALTEAGTVLVADDDAFLIPEALQGMVRLAQGQLELHPALLGEFRERVSDAAGPEVGWYRTGDIVEVISDQPLRFRIVGRERDWVNVGGHKVNPGEVEAVMQACAGVREARVYGRANSVLGQVLCAEVVADENFAEPAARAWLAQNLQPYKIPLMIKKVTELPKTRSGKVSRAGEPAKERGAAL